MRTGDFLRVPSGKIHWSWNRTAEPCTLVEVHAPGMQHDGLISGFAVGLFDDEPREFLGSPVTEFLPEGSRFDPRVAEQLAE